MLTVDIYAGRGHAWESRALTAIHDGFVEHGIVPRWIEGKDNWNQCTAELVVMWGHRQTDVINATRKDGRDYLVAELGYVGDRDENVSLGFNGLNGKATFWTEEQRDAGLLDDSRFRKHIEPLGVFEPQKTTPEDPYFLMAGQMEGDASLESVDINDWYGTTVDKLHAIYPEIPVYFRPHPNGMSRPPANVDGVLEGVQKIALNGAGLVVAYSSNFAVDAMMHGTPVYVESEVSMTWPVSAPDLAGPYVVDELSRKRWAELIGWTQWTHDEIAAGISWAHLQHVLLAAPTLSQPMED